MPILRHTFNGAPIVTRATSLLSLMLTAACTTRSAGFDPPPAIAAIAVTPAVATLAVGDSLDFTAAAFAADGTPVSGEVAWASTGGVTSSDGRYHAGGTPGTYLVIANSGDLSVADTAFITIAP